MGDFDVRDDGYDDMDDDEEEEDEGLVADDDDQVACHSTSLSPLSPY